MKYFIFAFTAAFCMLTINCSINKIAVNALSNALTAEGSSNVFMEDSDPRLVGDALPFTIKMYETLLQINPEHQGLLRSTGSLLIMYANAFVQGPAEQLPRWMYTERQAAYDRAKNLYLRGIDYIYRGLDLEYPGFKGAFQNNTLTEILLKMNKDDVPALYWAAAGGLSAYSLNLSDSGLGFRVPEFFALINRAYELDENYNSGTLDDFLIIYYASLPDYMGGSMEMAEIHFQKALEKSGGMIVSPYVSYAQKVSIPAQDYDKFKMHLETALSIDTSVSTGTDPANRLVNIISQRKARYLLDTASQYFFFLDTDNDFVYFEWDD